MTISPVTRLPRLTPDSSASARLRAEPLQSRLTDAPAGTLCFVFVVGAREHAQSYQIGHLARTYPSRTRRGPLRSRARARHPAGTHRARAPQHRHTATNAGSSRGSTPHTNAGGKPILHKFERTRHIQHARTDAHTANIDAHSQGASSPRTHVHAPGTPDTPSAAPMSDPTSGSFSSMIATISGGRNFNTEFMSVCPRMPARTEEQRHNMNTRNEHNTRGTYDA